MDEDKRRILFSSYFSSQFNYCPLIWMNHNKSINKKINNLHERALRLIYCDHSSNFQELLQRDNSVTIHQKNIQALAIMMYKVVNNIAPTIVSELFSFSNVNYSLRSVSQYHQPSANSVNHFILRTKNLVQSYSDWTLSGLTKAQRKEEVHKNAYVCARGNETKIIFICFQKRN